MERGHRTRAEHLGTLEIQRDGLRFVTGIDNLHDIFLRVLVVDRTGIKSVFALDGLPVLGKRKHVGALVGGIQHLHIPVDRAHAAQIVKPYQVGTPLPSLHMGEERGIGGLINHVGIALQTGHEGSLRECGLKVIECHRRLLVESAHVARIFSGKHFRAFTVVVVIAAGVLQEPVGRHIIVLVHEVDTEFAHLFPSVIEIIAACRRARRAADLDVGVFGADLFHEFLQAHGIQLAPLLVANADLFQVERRGVTHVGAQLSPLARHRTVGKLDEVEGVVNVGLQVFDGAVGIAGIVLVLVLAGQSHRKDGQRLGPDLLRQEEILIETETVGLVVIGIKPMREGVVPAVFVQRTVLGRAYAVLPLVSCGKVGTLYDAAAGETEDARFEVGEVLNEVGTQSVPAVAGEQAHVIEVDRLIALEENTHQTLLHSLVGSERDRELFPLRIGHGDRLTVYWNVLVVDDFDTDLGLLALKIVQTGIDGEVIFHALLEPHAEETAVFQASDLLVVAGRLQHRIVWITVESRLLAA